MSKRIIIVDDDKEVREIVMFVLSLHGYEVVPAASSQQLQKHLTALLPDLIILDVMMPGEDGFQICRGLRSMEGTRNIPIVIITAHAEEIYEKISEDLGVAHHMIKPFHPLELAEKVDALLGKDVK
jgi:DNA-binding response OmpR family regulator